MKILTDFVRNPEVLEERRGDNAGQLDAGARLCRGRLEQVWNLARVRMLGRGGALDDDAAVFERAAEGQSGVTRRIFDRHREIRRSAAQRDFAPKVDIEAARDARIADTAFGRNADGPHAVVNAVELDRRIDVQDGGVALAGPGANAQ